MYSKNLNGEDLYSFRKCTILDILHTQRDMVFISKLTNLSENRYICMLLYVYGTVVDIGSCKGLKGMKVTWGADSGRRNKC